MLTLKLLRLERDGLLVRTVHPVVPPKVEYTPSPRWPGSSTSRC
jgi:DNA-binding HxlR family transcriptional regulator